MTKRSKRIPPPGPKGSAALQSLASQYRWLPGAVLVGLVLLCYLPAFNAGYVMDDEKYATRTPLIRTLDGLRQAWFVPRTAPQYYPFLYTTLWVEYQLWQLNPVGYHAVNIVLFGCVVLMAWRVLLQLRVPGAWLGAAIFAVHPVCVESVAWVTKLMNVQSLLLALCSLWAYLRFQPADPPPEAIPSDSRRRFYVLSFVLFVLALLTKTVVASLPAVLLVIYWWKRGSLRWRDVWPLIPLFIVGAALGLTTAWLERFHAGAEGPEWSFTFVERCLIAGRAVCFYAGKLLWPYPIIFYYPRWTIDSKVWWQYLFPVAAAGAPIMLWLLRNRIGRAPLAGVLIYLGVLFPALGFFNIYAFRYSFVADHYQFHGMLAPISLAAAGVAIVSRRLAYNHRRFVYSALGLVLVVLAVISFNQARLYDHPETLYRDVIAKNANSWVAYSNLARIRLLKGDSAEAIAMYRRSLSLNPANSKDHDGLAGALLHIAVAPESRDRHEREIGQHLAEALRLDPRNVDGHVHSIELLMRQNKPAQAAEYFQSAERIDRPQALYGMGAALCAVGKWSEARPYLEDAIRGDPLIPEAHQALGNVLALQGKLAEAAERFRAATHVAPDYFQAWNNLGATLVNMGQPAEAIPYIKRALELRPDDRAANQNLQEAIEKQKTPAPG